MSTLHQRLDYSRLSADLFKKYLDFSMAFRMNVAFRTTPGSLDKMYGLDKAGLS